MTLLSSLALLLMFSFSCLESCFELICIVHLHVLHLADVVIKSSMCCIQGTHLINSRFPWEFNP